MGKKILLSILLAALVASSAIGYVNLKLPYVKDLKVTSITFSQLHENAFVVTGTVDVDFKNHKAWIEGVGGYKGGEENFPDFQAWWDDLEGSKWTFDGKEVKRLPHELGKLGKGLSKGLFDDVYVVKLWSVDWELLEHYKNHDILGFTVELQLVTE